MVHAVFARLDYSFSVNSYTSLLQGCKMGMLCLAYLVASCIPRSIKNLIWDLGIIKDL